MSHIAVRRHPVAGLWLVFFVNGAVLSSWAPRIPEVAASLALSDAALGGALFGVAAGSVPALFLTGRLLRHVAARPVCVASGIAFAGAFPLIAVATGPLTLALALAALGAASGTLDVAMNTAGVEFQRGRRRPVLSRLHGGYSLGVLTGAASGALATAAGVPVGAHFLAWSAALLLVLAVAGVHLPGGAARRRANDPAPTPGPRLPITLAVAGAAIAALLMEGTVTDWSALLLSRDLGAGATTGSTVVVAFSLAMFVSRSVGDSVVAAIGPSRYFLVAAAVLGGGSLVVLAAPGWPAAYGAIVALALAVGPVFPAVIAATAARAPESVASATAAVSAVGYFAYLGGPPLTGLLADHLTLPVTLAVTGVVGAMVFAVSGPRLGRRR